VKKLMAESGLKELLKSFKLNEKTLSRILGVLVLLVIGSLIFSYFRKTKEEISPEVLPEITEEIKIIEEEGKLFPEGMPKQYSVQEGDDLWKIAEKFYSSGYNWVDIASENQLGNPDLILTGQKLTLPKAEIKKPVVEIEEIPGPISGGSYQVQEGDNLWEIAVRAYGDGYQWPEIAKANKLANPNIIHSGNDLIIPR
jgi:nucleoid-associated protein YgaU